jgi:glyoxylase-like metal-dependent hydrolase (beta-lactamase superfamily II)
MPGRLEFLTVPVGPLQCNCYVLWDDAERALVIDPGDEPEKILGALRSRGLRPTLIVNTHGHFDHTGAVDALRNAFPAPYRIHAEEREILSMIPAGTKMWGLTIPAAPKPTEFLKDKDLFDLGKLRVEVLHTPGHTPGSCSFHAPALDAVFTGDTLFAGSIGRTDFPGGSMEQELASIHERLLALPPGTKVFPGHGPASTIAAEAESNPFLT